MKTTKRLTALMLAIMMLVPMLVIPASADVIWYGEQDFEALTVGKALEKGDGFAAVPAYSEVRADEDGNRYVRVPFVGGDSIGNWDKSIQVNHDALDNGYDFVIEADYRPHYNGNKNITVEAQFRQYSFTTEDGTEMENLGVFFNLYKINLSDGSITNCGTVVEGAVGMKLDEWNTLRLVFHPSNGHFEIYVNGALYSRQTNPSFVISDGGWQTFYNCSNVKIGADKFIVAKCNKVAAAYTETDLGEATNSIDVDNIRIYEAATATVELNGKEYLVGQSGRISLKDSDKKLVYAKVTLPDGTSYFTDEEEIDAVDGMVIETRTVELAPYAVEARLCTPLGVRFVTAVDSADFLALKADENVKEIRIGTLITLADALELVDTLTKEALVGRATYRDVESRLGAWYGENFYEGYYLFAGSVADLYRENYSLRFAGVGYIEVTLWDGSVCTVYASESKTDVLKGSAAECAVMEMRGGDLNSAEIEAMEELMREFDGGMEGIYEAGLSGLNVLAIGDSLFYGAQTTVGKKQWINMLGVKYGWHLTNLGIGGATISYNPAITANVSMYDRLFNTSTYKFGSKADSRYFNYGSPSGKAEDVDLILLQGGSNDYGPKVSAPKGEVGSTNPKEFLGAFHLMVEKLLVDYPNATVVMMTAWENGNQNREDKANAIEFTSSVVDLYEAMYADNPRVALIDSGSPEVSGVDMRNSTFRSQYAYDAFHLNDAGMELMADAMTPLLWDIVTGNEMKGDDDAVITESLSGKNVLVIGGSGFEGGELAIDQTWLALLAKQYGWNMTNLAQDGWTLTHNDASYRYPEDALPSIYDHLVNDSNYKFGSTSSKYYRYGVVSGKKNTDVDLVFLQAGLEDYNQNMTYGTLADRTETTYLGALNLTVERLLEAYPNAKIILTGAWHSGGANTRRMNYTVNGMRKVVAENFADNDRVMFFDAGAKEISGVNMDDTAFRKQYSIDGVSLNYLNAQGMKLVADNVVGELCRMIVLGKEPSAREEMAAEMKGLNVLAIGDSLFHGDFLSDDQTWIALLAQECGWNLTNIGRDGWTVGYNPEAYKDPAQVRPSMYDHLMNDENYKYGGSGYYQYGDVSAQSNEDIDLILLEGGTNDFGWGIPLGSVDDRTGGTVFGALNLMIEELMARYPNAKIVLVTSWHTKDATRMNFVVNAMKSIKETNYADDDRVAVLDAGSKYVSGVDVTAKRFLSRYAKNGTDINHLNAEGMQLVAENLLAEIWKLVK